MDAPELHASFSAELRLVSTIMILPQYGRSHHPFAWFVSLSYSVTGKRPAFIDTTHCVLASAETDDLELFLNTRQRPPAFALAGPCAPLFFDPTTITCGIAA